MGNKKRINKKTKKNNKLKKKKNNKNLTQFPSRTLPQETFVMIRLLKK